MTFILNVNNEHAQDYSSPRATLHSAHMEKSYLGKARLTTGLEVAPGQRKAHVNSNRHQTVNRGKFNPGVTDFPQVKHLPQTHVNRSLLTDLNPFYLLFQMK